MFLLSLRQLLPCFSSPRRSSRTNTPVFPPSSFILPSFAWHYIFFSTGQVLLSALSWCSACTSLSEVVFLIYLWREMHSTSTYSSTILFSHNISRAEICKQKPPQDKNLNCSSQIAGGSAWTTLRVQNFRETPKAGSHIGRQP